MRNPSFLGVPAGAAVVQQAQPEPPAPDASAGAPVPPATIDAATGTAELAPFLARLAAAFAASRQGRETLGAIVVTLADGAGSGTLDAGMRVACKRLLEQFSAEHMAQLGRDTIVIVVPGLPRAAELELGARLAWRVMAEPLIFQGVDLRLSINVTYAATAAELLANAAIARACATRPDLPAGVMPPATPAARPKLETQVREGIKRGGALLRYQPLARITDPQAVVGFEGLMRWEHTTLGILYPDQVPQIFDQTDLAVELGAIALAAATSQMRQWIDRGVPFGSVSLNLSPEQLAADDLASRVAAALANAGVAAHHLALEIGRSMCATPMGERVAATLTALGAAGVNLVYDGLEADAPSLEPFAHLPVSCIKLDPSFVQGEAGWAALPGVLRAAQESAVAVVAKGVETREQVARLQALGCEYVQGYVVARPMPPAKVAGFLERFQGVPSASSPSARAA